MDSHNSTRMFPISMEETRKTTRWLLRVICFLMAVTEVDCWLVLTNMYKQQEWSQQILRKELSREFLHNEYLYQLKPLKMYKSKRLDKAKHSFVVLPKNRTFKKAAMVYYRTAYILLVCSY